jgi:hypothetical protein
MFDHHGVSFQWPTSLTLEKNEYKDAFRVMYSDEVKNPGITWPSKVTNSTKQVCWAPLSDERDRIDYIFYKGKDVVTNSCFIVGPRESYRKGVLSLEHTENDNFVADSLAWPSDHKALIASLKIPANSPVSISKPAVANDLYEVYPNPCSNSIHVRAFQSGEVTIALLNLSGETLYTSTKTFEKGQDSTIDVAHLQSAVFLLKISDGKKEATYKVIKK